MVTFTGARLFVPIHLSDCPRFHRSPHSSDCFFIGIDEIESPLGQLSIYPNPTVDKVNVEFGEPLETKTELTIMDLTGRTVIPHPIIIRPGESKTTIYLSQLNAGIYLVNFNSQKFNTGQLIFKQ